MTAEQVAYLVVSGVFGGLVGGGAIAGLFYRALKDRLREDLAKEFPNRAELNGLGDRVTALSSVAVMAKDTTDANSDRITRLEESAGAERAALSRTLTRMDETLVRLADGWQKQQNEITRTVALLDSLEKRMDRHAPHE